MFSLLMLYASPDLNELKLIIIVKVNFHMADDFADVWNHFFYLCLIDEYIYVGCLFSRKLVFYKWIPSS